MPVGNLEFISTEEPPYSNIIHNSMKVNFDRDELLKYKKWGPKLTKEISMLPHEFDISPHVSNVMKCFEEINLVLINDDSPALIRSAEHIEQLISLTKDKQGVPIIFQLQDLDKQTGKNISAVKIPFHIIEYALNLKKAKLSKTLTEQ
jgi:hypothetical protein